MPNDFNATVARNIKFFRTERDLSEDDLVKLCEGIGKSLLNKIENCKHKKFVGTEHIEQIAKGLNVPVDAMTSSNEKLNEMLSTLEKQINQLQIKPETEFELGQALIECSKYGPIEQAKAFLLCGMFDFSKGKYESAMKFYRLAVDMADIAPYHTILFRARHNLGSVNLMIGNYDEALRCAKQNLLECDCLEQKALNLFLVGSVYDKKRKWVESEEAFLEVISLYQKGLLRLDTLVARCYQALGDICKNSGRFDEALTVSEKSIMMSKKAKDLLCTIYAIKTQGEVYLSKKLRNEALEKFIEARELAKEIGKHREFEVLKIEFCIALCRLQLDRSCSLLAKIEEQEIAPIEVAEMYKETARLADIVGKHNDASEYYEKAIQIFSL